MFKKRGVITHKFNKFILRNFNNENFDSLLKDNPPEYKVAMALQYVKIKTILTGKKINIHVHPGVDLDQRLSIYYIMQFLNITEHDINIIHWDGFKVLYTRPYDLVVDIEVDETNTHKDILIFDHHNGESLNTLEQLRHTIQPDIPLSLVEYVDKGHVEEYDIFKPQYISFLKDFSEEEIINIFKDGKQFDEIDKFKHKRLYTKWKDRKRKSKKTFKLLINQIYQTKFGKIAITNGALYNGSTLSLYNHSCDYYINIKEFEPGKCIMMVMAKDSMAIDKNVINIIKELHHDPYIYPNGSMCLIGSSQTFHKYIERTSDDLINILIKKFSARNEVQNESFCNSR